MDQKKLTETLKGMPEDESIKHQDDIFAKLDLCCQWALRVHEYDSNDLEDDSNMKISWCSDRLFLIPGQSIKANIVKIVCKESISEVNALITTLQKYTLALEEFIQDL